MPPPEKRMPERLMLTGPPEQAAAQLIADLERRGIMKRQQPDEQEAEDALAGWKRMLDKWRQKHHELQDCIVKNHELKKLYEVALVEIEELKRMNDILKGQIHTLLKLNAESARPSASGVRRGRGRRGNMDTILEASHP